MKRTGAGLTMRGFAQMVGTSHTYLWQVENGTVSIGFDMLCKFADALGVEALALIDRAIEVAMDSATTFLAQQQKATTLFQMKRFDEATAILEPLVRRQDAGAPTMLLASAYRKLGRNDDALVAKAIEYS